MKYTHLLNLFFLLHKSSWAKWLLGESLSTKALSSKALGTKPCCSKSSLPKWLLECSLEAKWLLLPKEWLLLIWELCVLAKLVERILLVLAVLVVWELLKLAVLLVWVELSILLEASLQSKRIWNYFEAGQGSRSWSFSYFGAIYSLKENIQVKWLVSYLIFVGALVFEFLAPPPWNKF